MVNLFARLKLLISFDTDISLYAFEIHSEIYS